MVPTLQNYISYSTQRSSPHPPKSQKPTEFKLNVKQKDRPTDSVERHLKSRVCSSLSERWLSKQLHLYLLTYLPLEWVSTFYNLTFDAAGGEERGRGRQRDKLLARNERNQRTVPLTTTIPDTKIQGNQGCGNPCMSSLWDLVQSNLYLPLPFLTQVSKYLQLTRG